MNECLDDLKTLHIRNGSFTGLRWPSNLPELRSFWTKPVSCTQKLLQAVYESYASSAGGLQSVWWWHFCQNETNKRQNDLVNYRMSWTASSHKLHTAAPARYKINFQSVISNIFPRPSRLHARSFYLQFPLGVTKQDQWNNLFRFPWKAGFKMEF